MRAHRMFSVPHRHLLSTSFFFLLLCARPPWFPMVSAWFRFAVPAVPLWCCGVVPVQVPVGDRVRA